MIESIYSKHTIIDEIDRSPYAPFVRDLAKELFRIGHKPQTILQKFGIILPLIRWSAHERLTPETLRARHVEKFFDSFKSVRLGSCIQGKRRCCESLFELIEKKYGHPLLEKRLPPFRKNPEVNEAVSEFERYLQDMRGLAPSSIERFGVIIGQFLFFVFPRGKIRLKEIEAKHILKYLETRGTKVQSETIRVDGAAIKSYMSYLYAKGLIKKDLTFAVPKIVCWRNKNVIHTIDEESMIKMLKTCPLDQRNGVRDYAVLLLLMRYGLRPIEICRLSLRDIRWNEKQLVIHGKGNKISRLPLEADVAAALRRYIYEARPSSREKAVFFNGKAPIVPLRLSSGISSIVRRAVLRAGLDSQIFGAKLLRYSVASSILNRGGNLTEVAELLRHSSVDTSVRYTRLDLKRLRLVPLAWQEAI